MELFEQYKKLQEAYWSAGSELGSFVRTNKKQILIELAQELKTIPGLNKVVVMGYTPGFNDGDACTHSSYPYWTPSGLREIAEYGISELYNFYGAPDDVEDELYDWDGIDTINTVSDEDAPRVNKLVTLLDSLVEEIYSTDYLVFVDLTTDEPTITHEYYECGY